MNVYIIGDCLNIQLADNGGRCFANAPADIMAIGGGYTIVSEIDNGDGTFEGEFKLREEVEFPYEDRPIRVELSDKIVTEIALNPETRPLMDWCYHLPNQKTETGLILWFQDFENALMSPEETEGLLLSLGAVIKRR